ncbi:putative T6SS immunity periplasmic lipoprotein [Serratia ficaria]|uniref:putative T6SS immunity periplasmic lipoprotein n=1 Tax=Serratia TaxID=613 RepID=UPI00077C746A|nr:MULTISPECIES: putative T6SS immunity periplasmic lipoprotein [Serratia]MEE4484627.1 putative T6SS immunity periplasmic lipoprotein [Serratia ficaria]
MGKYVILTAVFILTGCPGPGDKMVSRIPTSVTVKDNGICVLSPMKSGEKITAVQIYSDAGDKLIKMLEDEPAYIDNGECLPVFDYAFHSGRHYSIAYDVEALNRDDSHLITAEFSISSDKQGDMKIGN